MIRESGTLGMGTSLHSLDSSALIWASGCEALLMFPGCVSWGYKLTVIVMRLAWQQDSAALGTLLCSDVQRIVMVIVTLGSGLKDTFSWPLQESLPASGGSVRANVLAS